MLTVGFVEQVIGTLLILRKSRNMSEVIWKRVSKKFEIIENLEIKLKL